MNSTCFVGIFDYDLRLDRLDMMRSGRVRGGGIDRRCEMEIQELKNLNVDTLSKICKSIGGEQ